MTTASTIVKTKDIKRINRLYKHQSRFCMGERVQLADGRYARFEQHRIGTADEALVVIEQQ